MQKKHCMDDTTFTNITSITLIGKQLLNLRLREMQ